MKHLEVETICYRTGTIAIEISVHLIVSNITYIPKLKQPQERTLAYPQLTIVQIAEIFPIINTNRKGNNLK